MNKLYTLNQEQLSALHNAIVNAMQYCVSGRHYDKAVLWADSIITADVHPDITEVCKSWRDAGVSGSTNSGIAYKNKLHNEGMTFAPEQIYGNLKRASNRENVINALLTAASEGTPYNKDRRSAGFTAEGLRQGLQSYSRKYRNKAELAAELAAVNLLNGGKNAGKTATLANQLLEARMTGQHNKANEVAGKLVRTAPKTVPASKASTIKLID
jgi:hypothetical protein